MKWRGRRQSTNLEDRRGTRIRRAGVGGGLGVVAILLIGTLLGVDPRVLLGGVEMLNAGAPVVEETGPYQETAAEAQTRQFLSVVLADTEDVWNTLFRQTGGGYREPRLVLFSGAAQSACGFAEAAMGPFYCPPDERVFIDMAFFDDLGQRMGAGGDFAQAYVVAHEIGHHVQNLLGTSGRVRELQQRRGGIEARQLSVRLELQADCYAGIWAHHAERMRGVLEAGDLEEALGAASAVGDDRLQRQAQGYVVPDSFTHGSSAQRMRWFRMGFDSGSVAACDTFAAGAP
jgi:predicted metalloprotease